MRLLIVVTQYEAAGAQKIALALAEYAGAAGHQASVAFLYDKQGDLPALQQSAPFPIYNLDCKAAGRARWRNVVSTVTGLLKLLRLLRGQGYDALISFTIYSNLLVPPLAWLAGVPRRVASQRNSLPHYPRLLWRLDRLLVNCGITQLMIAPSARTRAFCVAVEGMQPQRVVVIPNGVRLPPSTVDAAVDLPPLRRLVVLTVARLHPQKGHAQLLQAAAAIRRERDDVSFLLVGDGELRSQLIEQIRDLGLGDCVHLLGMRQDVERLLQISDLFVLPSLFEGMSNALLEAMAAGVAVITTDVDGVDELIADGENGWVVAPGDSAALAAAIQKLLNDRPLRRRLGAASRQTVAQRFSLTQSLQRYLDLLQQPATKQSTATS